MKMTNKRQQKIQTDKLYRYHQHYDNFAALREGFTLQLSFVKSQFPLPCQIKEITNNKNYQNNKLHSHSHTNMQKVKMQHF